MHRLYQWLHVQASFLRRVVWEHGVALTLRREVMTIQREQRMLLLESISPQDFDICPFCGQKLPTMPVAAKERYP